MFNIEINRIKYSQQDKASLFNIVAIYLQNLNVRAQEAQGQCTMQKLLSDKVNYCNAPNQDCFDLALHNLLFHSILR